MSSSSYESLKPLFDPTSIAIIGASDDIYKFGGRPIFYMKQSGFDGPIYPINPKGGEIQGLKAYADVREIGEPVDLAVVSVPAKGVVDQIAACAEAGVKGAVIFSSGFAETDAEGEAWQRRLTEIARESGIRLVGPNCMGMLNVKHRAIGTFSSMFDHGWPRPGNITILSQSGAVGSHTLVLARERGLGVRGWMTTGNECDVDVADCMLFAAEDPETDVLAIYMEGCRNPERLIQALETARRRKKAVVVMKVGASEVGAVAASSHTASLAGADKIFDAVYRQHGAYRVHSLAELLEVSAACSTGRYPKGRRLGIVTVSGGAGVMASDAAATAGLEVPALPEAAQKELKALMPFAAVRNPVDTTAQVLNNIDLLRRNLEVMLEVGDVDATLLFLSSVGYNERLMAPIREVLVETLDQHEDALLVASVMLKAEDKALLEERHVIHIEDPSRAVALIGVLAGLRESFDRPVAEAPPALPATARPAGTELLNEVDAAALLRAAGLPVAECRLVASREEAVAAAAGFGGRVVLKVVLPDIQHKSEVGGVRVGLEGAEAVDAAHDEILASARAHAPDARIDGIMVAPMLSGGVECILGTSTDPVFGPVVAFGLGGIFVEVLRDVTFRVAPFGLDEAHRMMAEVQGFAMLEGVRGEAGADLDALAEALARLSVFAAANRDTVESIDLNPVLALPDGIVALDALVVPKAG